MSREPPETSAERLSQPLRERFSLRFIMTWTNVVSVLAASLIAGYFALTILYQNKLTDTWAIMFLELEHQGSLLADRLNKLAAKSGQANDYDGILRIEKDGTLTVEQGGFASDMRLADFKLDRRQLLASQPPLSVLTTGGEPYLARIESGRLRLRKVPASLFDIKPAPPASQGALYLLTREGRLLYTSDTRVAETTVVDRALVQRFIQVPIKQGQMELTDAEGEAFYGFFAEIPQTNIVMFSEVRQSVAMAPVRRIVLRFLGVLGLILLGAAIVLQLPLGRLTSPVRELAELAITVGQGRFDVRPVAQGFGELSVLTSAFSTMAKGLVERDRKVAALIHEQTERARLEGELVIARRIQENLLPQRGLPSESGLVVAAEYIAAAECAGDWYNYSFDPDRRESIVVIADVSGHGAGSSMFTAVIAGLFDEFRSRQSESFDLVAFATSVNDVMFRLGRQQWHATMMMARHTVGDDALDVLLAGHPPPILRASRANQADFEQPVFLGSSVLGLSLEFQPELRRFAFAKGTSLVMYTDGLTEAANQSGKMYARRRLRTVVHQATSDEPHNTLQALLDDWRAYLGGASPEDDVCVVVMRAA